MDQDEVLKVVQTLVGCITPYGATHIDRERKKNLEVFLEVFDEMHTMIDDVIYQNSEACEHSIKEMVKMCEDKLKNMGFTEQE